MIPRLETCLLACSCLALAGCSAEAPTETSAVPQSEESLVAGETGDESTLLEPRPSARPERLRWVPGQDGLELAAWTVLEEPLVYCLIRNPTDEPVSLPGGRIGIGFPGMSVVRARPVGMSQWTKIPWDIGPTNFPNNLGCLVPALLEPGSELPNTDRRFDDHEILNLPGWTFSVWLSGYDFPEDWSGVVDVRIDCLVHQFPSVQLPLEVIRLGRAAHFARVDAWNASREAK